ncbi:hypothetical protein [Pedobacter sp. Leaf170]|nr:hypothetical protein [Pedobacter sp. Leaf170]
MTYTEFRNAPYLPNDAAVIQYFKIQLNLYTMTHMGTAGTNGTGSPNIVFRNEERSDWTNPNDC